MATIPNGPLRIAFLGTAEFAVPTLRALAAGPDEIAAVFTRPDRPAGRGRKLRAPPVKAAALELGLPVRQPDRVSRGEGLGQLRGVAPDLLFVAAFGEILGEAALAVARLGSVNLHASLLPRYRGAAPIQRALMAGEEITGVTVQWMAPELDAGDIIVARERRVGEEEDFGSLHDRLAALGAQAAEEALDLIRFGKAPRLPQDHGQATFAPPISPEELVIDWARPAEEVARLVRALSPRPGARTRRRGDILKVLSARAGKTEAGKRGIPGQVIELAKDGFWVETGEGRLLALRVQPAGGRVMSAADFAKGRRVQAGEQLSA